MTEPVRAPVRVGGAARATVAAALAWLALGSGPAAAAAQEEAGADSLPAAADTLPGVPPGRLDTLARHPGDTADLEADTAGSRAPPHYPRAVASPDSTYGGVVWACDRSCLLLSSASTLADLLESRLSGYSVLRGAYYGGPHHLTDGLLGAGFVSVRSEELPVMPLEGGQVDLTRIPLAWVEEIRVLRTPLGTEVVVEPVRFREKAAYSRVTAGTGEPNANAVRALYANGFGPDVALSTGIDLLNTEGRAAGSDRLDFWGQVAWVPSDSTAGAELVWRTQNLTRVLGEAVPTEFRRRDVHLRARGRLGPGLSVHVAGGGSQWTPTRPGERGRVEEEEVPPEERSDVQGAVASVDAVRPGAFGRLTVGAWNGLSHPNVVGGAHLGFRPGLGLEVEAEAEVADWDRFTTALYGAGARLPLGLGVGLELSGRAATGTRGVPRPWIDAADSLRVRTARGEASFRLGPVRLSGGGGTQRLSPQRPLHSVVDRGASPVPEAEVAFGEGSVEAPVIPLGRLLEGTAPVRLRAWWRHYEVRSDLGALYVPAEVGSASLLFADEFFQGDLELRVELSARHRGAMTSVRAGSGERVVLPAHTTTGFNLVVRLLDARIWWRRDNLGLRSIEDYGGLPQPRFRSSFGVKWDFFN